MVGGMASALFASPTGNAGPWVPASSSTQQLFATGRLGAGGIGGQL